MLNKYIDKLYIQYINIIMKYEWDERKSQTNIEKHGVDFKDVKEIFENVRITAVDTRKDYGEVRKISIGMIGSHICVVVYTMRKDVIRIISARKANQRERRRFYEFINEAKRKED